MPGDKSRRLQKRVSYKGKVLEDLKGKLSDPVNYFTSFKEIHEWLEKEHNIRLSYVHVHDFVREHLGAKLKVVRKSNLKKDTALEDKRCP